VNLEWCLRQNMLICKTGSMNLMHIFQTLFSRFSVVVHVSFGIEANICETGCCTMKSPRLVPPARRPSCKL
jgi:hypothetical protein